MCKDNSNPSNHLGYHQTKKYSSSGDYECLDRPTSPSLEPFQNQYIFVLQCVQTVPAVNCVYDERGTLYTVNMVATSVSMSTMK